MHLIFSRKYFFGLQIQRHKYFNKASVVSEIQTYSKISRILETTKWMFLRFSRDNLCTLYKKIWNDKFFSSILYTKVGIISRFIFHLSRKKKLRFNTEILTLENLNCDFHNFQNKIIWHKWKYMHDISMYKIEKVVE